MNKLGKYSRSVSIIGVGCTPFMYTVDNEETNGLTEGPGSVCNGNFKITTSISSESIWDGSFNIAQ